MSNVVAELEVPRAMSDLDGDGPSQRYGALGASDRAPPARAWADLLEGALHADWEGLDGELRQFLSGFGRPDERADGYGGASTWPLCIVAATALLVARRTANAHRRLFRRPVDASLWASARRPVPFGPWPLGPP